MSGEALHFCIDGPEGAPALLLGASLGTTLDVWSALLPRLTGAYRVIRFDHRGHGKSRTPPGPYALADLGADVVALLDRLEIERVSFCGVSLGGMVGMWLAAEAPTRVDRLALVCTSAFLPPPEAWHTRAATVRERGMSALTGAVVARWFTASFAARHPAIVSEMATAFERVDPEGYASCCEAIAGWDLRARLSDIRAPTLIVAGGADVATDPSHGYAIGAGIPGARVAVVENAAHLAVVEQPDEVADLLLGHLGMAATSGRAGAGEAVRRAVLGHAHVDRARQKASSFSAPFQDLVNRFPWGDLWTRPGLTRGERSIVTLTALAALHHDDELAMHILAALRNGLSTDQIREVLLHVGAYAGIPVANRSLAIAERALQQAGALEPATGKDP
jgi:3-oxoadipate enol-lactonase/4-carboxymuconolactone decarboxylase